MADVLSTGLSGLRALQRALDTTSHNIANVATDGYTRQRVEFQTRQAEYSAGGWIGTGVLVSRSNCMPRVPDPHHAASSCRAGCLPGENLNQPSCS